MLTTGYVTVVRDGVHGEDRLRTREGGRPMAYSARSWTLDLNGLSKAQLDVHFALYQGYVTNTNRLNDTIAQMIKVGKGNTPDCVEMKRRLGFEYNGMVLHEYYFDNLQSTEI